MTRTASGASAWTFDMAKSGIHWDESMTATAAARARLPQMAQAYFKAGRKLADAPASFHKFRLATKALRYTLELFRPCYGPALDRRLSALAAIQDSLGAISDCATTRELIAAKLPEDAPERIRMDSYLDAAARRKRLEFRRYWLRTFDQPGQERLWLNYLSRPRH